MGKRLLFILLTIFSLPVFAQQKYTVSGVIKDEATGEQLIGASIRINELPQNGTATNSYGFYSLTAPAGEYNLIITYIGYQTISRQISFAPKSNS